MLQQIFLKLDGVVGESTDVAHRDEIMVLGWDHGFEISPSTSARTRRRSQARKLEVVFIHHFDKASPVLMQRCLSGTIIPNATLSVIYASPGQAQSSCTLKIEMRNVVIVKLESSGLSGEDKMVENVTLDFEQIVIEYIQIDSSGRPSPSVSSSWDFRTNTPI